MYLFFRHIAVVYAERGTMSLSAWGCYGDVWLDLASPTPPRKFRPRRPSYVLATQMTRQRSQSYHSPTDTSERPRSVIGGRLGHSGVPAIAFYAHEDADVGDDEDIGRADRGDGSLRLFSSPELTPSDSRSRRTAGGDSRRSSRGTLRSTLDANHVSATSRPLSDASPPPGWTTLFGDRNGSHAPSETDLHRMSLTEFAANFDAAGGADNDEDGDDCAAAIVEKLSADTATVWRRRKNFIALSIGFLLIYTAFRSIQALQSSINAAGRLGVVAMACVHGCMAAVCPLLAPTVAAGRPPPKWTVVLAAVLYVGWMTANLWPHPLTLLPTSLVAGVAQCIGWAALIAFMRSLQHDDDIAVADAEGDPTASTVHHDGEHRRRRECRLNAAFVACFQSSHIWGNLVSSLMLDDRLRDGASAVPAPVEDGGTNSTHQLEASYGNEFSATASLYCGVYDPCSVSSVSNVWNLANPGTVKRRVYLFKGICTLHYLECYRSAKHGVEND